MKYWPQQLNFAVFCATQGCGVSREIFDYGMNLPRQIRAFYIFHVYFTVSRILYQLGGIQRISALPGDPPLNQMNNHYDVASYKRVCDEFGIDPSGDFRFTQGKNHGLGSVYIGVTGHGSLKTRTDYPGGFYNSVMKAVRQAKEICFLTLNLMRFLCSSGLVCAKHSIRFDAGGLVENQPVNRGFRLLHPWRAGERPQQHSRFG